jgi:putative SOS response-associated peptidase YedK
MCGRFAQTIPLKDLIKLFFADEIKTDIGVSFNIAPSQQVAALIKNDKKRILGDLRWGLIPPWAKDV